MRAFHFNYQTTSSFKLCMKTKKSFAIVTLSLYLPFLALYSPVVSAQTKNAKPLVSFVIQANQNAHSSSFEGRVEAVKQSSISTPLAGMITELRVKAGDSVKAGQVLMRIDGRTANQNLLASQAQVNAAQAQLEAVKKDYERQQQLLQKNYISKAAFEQSEAQYKAALAQLNAQKAQSGIAGTQSDLLVIKAPYNGIVAELHVLQGDMAMPGKPLLQFYDPSALRVSTYLPQSQIASLQSASDVRIQLGNSTQESEWINSTQLQILPTIDPNTHTTEIRANLPANLSKVLPGMSARIWMSNHHNNAATLATAPGTQKIWVPSSAILQRSELTAVYVLDKKGKPLLRQVRLGKKLGTQTEILSGLNFGERIAEDAQTASRHQ